MDLRRQLLTFKRWIPLLVLGAVVAGMLAFMLLNAQPRIYEASTTLKLGQPLSGAPILLTSVSDRLLTEYAYRGTAPETIGAVAERLELSGDVDEIRKDIATEIEPSSTLLSITARATSRDGAAELADAVSAELISLSQTTQSASSIQQELTQDVLSLRQQIDRSRAELAGLREVEKPTARQLARIITLEDQLVALIAAHGDALDRLLDAGSHSLQVVSPATGPSGPVEPRPLLYTALAVALGILIAAAIAVIIEYFDDRLRDATDLEEASGLPTLASIVELKGDAKAGGDRRLVTATSPRSPAADTYRLLRANLELTTGQRPLRSLLVTGSEPADGKSVTAANLAVAFAQSGKRVVLIDGDLRHPSIHTFFRLPNERGLGTLLSNPKLDVAQVLTGTPIANLTIMPAGDTTVSGAGAGRLAPAFAKLLSIYDLIIVDGAALPAGGDALTISTDIQQTLLVVTQGRTRRGAVRQALDALGIAHASVLGTALFHHRRGSSTKRDAAPSATTPEQSASGKEALRRARPT